MKLIYKQKIKNLKYMKKELLFFLVLSICFNININIDNLNKSYYYLGQIDKYENFKICFDSNKFSGFFVINISPDIKFFKEKNCLYVYSLKDSKYGKKFIKLIFVECLDPFDTDLCNAFSENKKTINLLFDLSKCYKINVFYNKTGYIHSNCSVFIKIDSNSLGKSYFNIEDIKIDPKKYKYYDIKKDKNEFKIVFYPVMEDNYKISFDIIRNNFEKTHLNLNVQIKPTLEGKIKNIKTGTLLIPSYLQGFYSFVSLFF